MSDRLVTIICTVIIVITIIAVVRWDKFGSRVVMDVPSVHGEIGVAPIR